jgi:uncharacterized lipoprotein NlpE involved in copper resistance
MKTLIITAMIATVALTGCGDSKEVKAEKAAKIAAQKIEDKRKGFHCLSGWDGSHRGVEKYLKANLRDPDSYQHNKTIITSVKDGKHTLITTYRAKNGFGGYVGGGIVAEIDNETCQATIIAQD